MSRDREEEGVQSIRDKISIREMGTRSKLPFDREQFMRVKGQIIEEIVEEKIDKIEKKQKKEEYKGRNYLLNKIEEELRYSPKTKENRLVYEQLLNNVMVIVGDMSEEVLKSLVDEVIVCLKNDLQVDSLFQELDADQLTDMKALVVQITDYVEHSHEEQQENIQEEVRVGVNFDSDEEEKEYKFYVQEGQQDGQVEETQEVFDLQQNLRGLEVEADQVIKILKEEDNQENGLMELFNYEHVELIKSILMHKETLLQEGVERTPIAEQMEIEGEDNVMGIPKRQVDLEQLQADMEQSQLLNNEKCRLPQGSFKISKKGYEEIHVPAQSRTSEQQQQDIKRIIKISSLPVWQQQVFSRANQFNPVQSQVFDCAMNSDQNMLVCAPTGAGKTFIAVMTMLNIINKFRDSNTGKIDKSAFKIIYIAPMKALVAEMVGGFTQLLDPLGLEVRELTGDVNMSKYEMERTQVIVCTPEKYDIITRKTGDQVVIKDVKCLIIDEVHLLNDQRGPVLEAIVARTLRQQEQTQEYIRIVALSATLPNYKDVALFCRVDLHKGLFYFDNTYRPVPLDQQFIGITEKKGIKKLMVMNNILYDKVIERAGKSQTIIFTHSRKDTIKTAKFIKEMAYQRDELGLLVKRESRSESVLSSEAASMTNKELGDLVRLGIGVHHAGLSRVERTTMEDLFSDRHLSLLVSTATLAWGVNLPAHTVIIKGTQVYSPEQGKWVELSNQDVLQMIGRAGRPTLDTKGVGIIITGYQELKYYLSLINHQMPIESQMITSLVDTLNAEIQLGSITTIQQAVQWLAYTYLYIRMLRAPLLYDISPEAHSKDRLLLTRRTHLIHSALITLDNLGLAKYHRPTGLIQPTPLGKIASFFYLKHQSVSIYNQHLKQNTSIIEVMRVFGLSSEFRLIPIREEEKVELVKLMDSVPVPVKTSPGDPCSKVNVLLQAYISRLTLQGQAINSDMVFVRQSAGRILRALFQMALTKGWAQLAQTCLSLAKMVENQMWACMTPLRQFTNIPEEILRRIEKKEQFNWEHFYQMSPQQLGELVKFPKLGKVLHKYINQLPRLELQAFVQPITRQTLKVDLSLKTDFLWDNSVHGNAQHFWLFLEDCDSETLLHSQNFQMSKDDQEKIFEIYVSLFEPLQPVYFIRVVSDRWLGSESVLPISFKNLILPAKFQVSTEVKEQEPLQTKRLENNMLQVVLESIGVESMNQIQSQIWEQYYLSNENQFLGCSYGNGRGVLQVLALMQTFKQSCDQKAVYLSSWGGQLVSRQKLFNILGKYMNLKIVVLTGQLQVDIKLMEGNDIILSRPEHMDQLSRRWRSRKSIQQVSLLLIDNIHLLNQGQCTLEVVCSRFRYMSSQLQSAVRLCAFGYSIANYKDIADWLGVSSENSYNFSPKINPRQLDIQFQSFEQSNRVNRLAIMQKHVQLQIEEARRVNENGQVMVVLSDRKECRSIALELCTYIGRIDRKQHDSQPIDLNVKHCLQSDIGLLYEGMADSDSQLIQQSWQNGLGLLVVSHEMIVKMDQSYGADLVLVVDIERYSEEEQRMKDLEVERLTEMIPLSKTGKVVINLESSKVWYYRKHMGMALPVESQLNHFLGEHLNSEVVAKSIENKQDCIDWLTWTYFYRRLSQNPNYYNLYEVSGQHLNDYLSDLVENSIGLLETQGCLLVEDEVDLVALNPGIISSYYYMKTSCIYVFQQTLTSSSSLTDLLEVFSKSFADKIVLRASETPLLELLNGHVKHKLRLSDRLSGSATERVSAKVDLLLQCHFDRVQLNADLQYDQKIVLIKAVDHLHAMIDVISSQCNLKQAILAMQLCQMIVQAMYTSHSQLLQLPHLNHKHLDSLKQHSITDIDDFIQMEDSLRTQLLSEISSEQLNRMALVCNRFPQLELSFSLENTSYSSGEEASLNISLIRQADPEDYSDYVTAHYFPSDKTEHWYVVLGANTTNHLLAIKKFSIRQQSNFTLYFTPECSTKPVNQQYNIYLICDSYVGADQSHKFNINVIPQADMQQE